MSRKQQKPFSIKHTYQVFDKKLLKPVVPLIDRALALNVLNNGYFHNKHLVNTPEFTKGVINYYQLHSSYNPTELDRIPLKGACILVVNHPTGIAETILLYDLLATRRQDVKFMATTMLENVEQAKDIMISTDPFENKNGGTKKTNIKAVRSAASWLEAGHLLVVFPSGEVSHFHLKEKQVMDRQWSSLPITLSKKTGSPIIPVFCEANNRWWFHAAGMIHPLLRTMLLPRAFKRQAKKTMGITVGHPIPKAALSDADPKTSANWLKMLTYALPYQTTLGNDFQVTASQITQPIIAPVPAEKLLSELANLPESAKLLSYRHFSCYAAYGRDLKYLLTEIGRTRELTYRDIGEGTGLPADNDRYDQHYIQLFIWDHQANQLVGGYRIGLLDQILQEHGASGYYMNEYYKNPQALFPSDAKCIEVGRSYITPDYQGQYQPLLLLWQGIGRIILRNPGYRYLLGIVSLSQQVFSPFALRFLVACLRRGQYRFEGKEIIPHKPYSADLNLPKPFLKMAEKPLTFQHMKHTIESLENRPMQLPILLKHYCQQLGSRCVSFSEDPAFGNSLDILIFTDLMKTKPEFLARYLGRNHVEAFYQQFKQPL